MLEAKTCGDYIRKLRVEKGLTQKQLAEMLLITNRAISKWENGECFPDITILSELAKILNCTTDEILNGGKIKATPINSDSENDRNVKVSNYEPTRNKNEISQQKRKFPVQIVTGGLLSLLGICSLLLFWILSITSPADYNNINTGKTYTGLAGFLLYHNAIGLFFFVV